MDTTIEVGAIFPSTCTDSTGALDVTVTVTLPLGDGTETVTGEVTLLPREDGTGYDSWGSPDQWVSGLLLCEIRDHEQCDEILAKLAREAGAACDDRARDDDEDETIRIFVPETVSSLGWAEVCVRPDRRHCSEHCSFADGTMCLLFDEPTGDGIVRTRCQACASSKE